MSIWWIAVIVIVILLIACVVYSLVLFGVLCGRGRKPDGLSITRYYPDDQAAPYRRRILEGVDYLMHRRSEKVSMIGDGGTALEGLYLHADEPCGRVLMFCHGYHGGAVTDLSLYGRWFLEHGYDILSIEQRAHGDSAGRFITFGHRERYDCLAWTRYLCRRLGPDAKVVLFGVSMGAATVMSAMGLGLPEQVEGVIADCGYTSIADEYPAALHLFRIPMFPAGLLAAIWCRLFAGFSVHDRDGALKALAASDLPIMLVHGGDDPFVPTEMVYELEHAARDCRELLVVPGAAHAGSWLLDEGSYEEALGRFLDGLPR